MVFGGHGGGAVRQVSVSLFFDQSDPVGLGSDLHGPALANTDNFGSDDEDVFFF